ncbi:MAG: DUF917 domain-containing protein [Candidatus Dadabacteria bacterium]|nr:MAG: DUF917 domain-containing protein [Candidatus Dadabacteria bacterium]
MNNSVKELIIGSAFFGTGGGGSPAEAEAIFTRIYRRGTLPPLVDVSELDSDALVVSGFGVGSIEDDADESDFPYEQCVFSLKQYLGHEISAVIPVEIGPYAVAAAFELAAHLQVPVVDADVVGGRSAPEVFLETLTLFRVPRTPAVAANRRGDVSVLLRTSSPQAEEGFFRMFASFSEGTAYVLGYPLLARDIRNYCETGTVSDTRMAGSLLSEGKIDEVITRFSGCRLFRGVVHEILKRQCPGFLEMEVLLEGEGLDAKIYVKNENLILWINGEVALTCPDCIILLNADGLPVYNLDLREGIDVEVLGFPARALWRSAAGQKLFSPRTFGYTFGPRILNCPLA